MPTQNLFVRRRTTAVVFLAAGIVQSTWFARIPAIGGALGLPVGSYWQLITTFALGAVLGLISAPFLVSAFGTRTVLISSALIFGPVQILVAVSAEALHSVPTTMVTVALFSLSFGLIDVSMNIDGVHVEHDAGRNVMTTLHAFYSTGAVLGSLMALISVANGIGPTVNFIASATLGTVLILSVKLRAAAKSAELAASIASRPSTSATSSPLGQRLLQSAHIIRNGAIAILVVLAFCFTSNEGTATNLIALATEHGHDLPAESGTVSYVAFMVAMMITRFAGSRIADRLGRHKTLTYAAIVGAAGVLLFIFNEGLLMYCGAFMWGVGCANAFPLVISMAGDGDRPTAALRVSLMSVAGYTATFIGPPLVDFLGGRVGILQSFLVTLILFSIAGILVTVHKTMRRSTITQGTRTL